jgi:hypothetical protein
VKLSDIKKPKTEGRSIYNPKNFLLRECGIQIKLGKLYHAKRMEISMDRNNTYQIIYLHNNLELAKQTSRSHFTSPSGKLVVNSLDVPGRAVQNGYNRIIILPLTDNGMRVIGHIRPLK